MNTDTIREALIGARDAINTNYSNCSMNCWADKCDEALAALSTIEADEAFLAALKTLLTDDSVYSLLRYGYKSPSNFIDGDDCTTLNILYAISNELIEGAEK